MKSWARYVGILMASYWLAGPAYAQNIPAPKNTPSAETAQSAEKNDQKNDSSSNLYQDNYLKDSAEEDSSEETAPSTGPVRFLSVDTYYERLDYSEGGGGAQYGARIGAGIETKNFGALSVDATMSAPFLDDDWSRAQHQKRMAYRATVWQKNFFPTNRVVMDNAVGYIYTPASPLMASQRRFYLPLVPVEGLLLSGKHLDHNLSFAAAGGNTGRSTGGPYPGFEANQGHAYTFFVSKTRGEWDIDVAAAGSDGNVTEGALVNTDFWGEEYANHSRSLFMSVRKRQKQSVFQLNLLSSRADYSEKTHTGQGVWLEGETEYSSSPYSFSYGLYSLDPNLTWGFIPIMSNAQGGFGRVSYKTPRRQWSAALDVLSPKKGTGFDGWYFSSYFRQQKNPTFSYGGNLSLRHSTASQAGAIQGYVEKTHRLGQSRLQLDVARVFDRVNHIVEPSWQAEISHAWPYHQNFSLSHSLSFGQWSVGKETAHVQSLGTTLAWKPTEKTTLSSSAKIYKSQGLSSFDGQDIQLMLQHDFTPRLSGTLNVLRSRSDVRDPFQLDPLRTEAFYKRTEYSSVSVGLRYRFDAGTPYRSLGGNGAAGSIRGVLFADANKDGVQNYGERGLGGVSIVLDGRYQTTTQENGSYSFDRVVVGKHTLTTISDNIPLPWSEPEPQHVIVNVRRETFVGLGAQSSEL